MQDFLSTVILLFIVIDPVGLAPMIQGMLKKYSPAQQKAILTRELVFALSLLLLFFFSGKFLLNLLGLSHLVYGDGLYTLNQTWWYMSLALILILILPLLCRLMRRWGWGGM